MLGAVPVVGSEQPRLEFTDLARGDHVFVWRRFGAVPFQHHAIDCGDGSAAHFSDGDGGIAGPGLRPDQFAISRIDLERLTRAGRAQLHIVQHQGIESDEDEIVERALSQLGRRGYNLLYDNCEHFARWCVTGKAHSVQVSTAAQRCGAAAAKVATLGAAMLAKKSVKALNPWLLAADAVQLGTEMVGHHVGLQNPVLRKATGRALGGAVAVGVGALASTSLMAAPLGIAIAGGTWCVGELTGEVATRWLDRCQTKRRS